jgi:hypothetical protein
MLPAADDLTLREEDRRELILWAGACVERLVPIFHADRPEDSRLDDALRGARRFAGGGLGVEAIRKLAFGCHAAAREASDDAAKAVARATGQAVAVAHMGGHSRELARYTRKALCGDALASEIDWQQKHVPERFRAYVFGR